MDQIRNFLPCLKSRNEKKELFSHFCKNGSLVLEELIASFGGRYKLPIRSFTAKELIKASNNFAEKVHQMIDYRCIFRGNLEGRPVLLNFYMGSGYSSSMMNERILNGAIRDIVITSQMSHHKNVLKLIGCSLEFMYPAMVYEYAGTELLTKYLSHENDNKLLSWRSRIKIASDIANVITHLHTAFPTPIIHRDLSPSKVIIDQCGVAKLFDFTTSINLPPGEPLVEDTIRGTWRCIDPQYFMSGIVTQKIDIYVFGMLMLALLFGENTRFYHKRTQEDIGIRDYAQSCLEHDQFNQIVDPKIFEEEGNNELRQSMLAFLELALRCTEYEGIDRPGMIDVAKELLQIGKSVHCC